MTGEWPLAGRREELDRVSRTVVRRRVAADRKSGPDQKSGPNQRSGIVLAGAPGVGKTRLAKEALAIARKRGAVTPWVTATASAASIPLGAMARLLPPLGGGSESGGLSLLRQAMTALEDSAAGRDLVLGVDDAHLIDDVSATLLQQLVLSEAAALVLTVRSGQPAPEMVTALWKDGFIDRLELLPLARAEVDELVGEALGGPVDSATLERLWQLTEGNALFLREVLAGAQEANQLVQRSGLWRWEAEFSPTPRLAELLRGRLSNLPGEQRALVDALAFGEPLGVALSSELASAEAVRDLERAGVVVVDVHGRRQEMRLAHPLYAEVIRMETSSLRAADLRRALARVQADGRLRRRGDVLRQATLLLEADGRGNPDLLTAAAAQAEDIDPLLAERMARAAIAAGGGFDARLVLAAALHGQVRVHEAEAVLSEAAAMASDPRERAVVALSRAPNLFWGQGRADEADATLDEAQRDVREEAPRALLEEAQGAAAGASISYRLTAMRSAFSLFQGHPRVAADLAGEVLSSCPPTDAAIVAAAAPASHALARMGRVDDSLAMNARGWAAFEARDDMAHFRSPLLHCEITALTLAGRIGDAADRAQDYHRWLMRQPWSGTGLWCAGVLQGQTALAQGRPATAARWLREAAGASVDLEPVAWLYWCHLGLTEALASLGDGVGAAKAMDMARAVRRPVFLLWEPDRLMAEAWVAVAGGETSRAVDLLVEAAAHANQGGQAAIEAAALHTLVRLGQPATAAARLDQLVAEVQGELVAAFSAHAVRLVADDGPGLDDVSSRFEDMEARLLAAEAAAEAAGAHGRAGRRASSLRAADRAGALASECEHARTPALDPVRRGATATALTRRENEVAGLAARGLTNRAIAERLSVSVRTVENHLDAAYAKLGLHSRAELTTALGIDPERNE